MDLSDKTVLVAGLGISGRSMMEVLRSRAAPPTIGDPAITYEY